MTNFQRHLYHPYTDDDQSLDEGFVSSVKEKLGLAPPKSKFRKALDSIKSKFKSQKTSAFGKALEHLKANKGRLAAKAAGAIGANMLASKMTGNSLRDDVVGPKANFKRGFARGMLATSGAHLGGLAYDVFKNR